MKDGENVYVLESILIHKGGAYGGHYYAYINTKDGWMEFNDIRIKKVEDIQSMIDDSYQNGYMYNYVKYE